MAQVQPSHVPQCMKELLVKCLDPRRIRTKTYLLGNWNKSEYGAEIKQAALVTYVKNNDRANHQARE